MASSSIHLYQQFRPSPHHRSATVQTSGKPPNYVPVRCGPRDNRGPLHKGRTLSIEAIQAVQSLKRSHRLDPTNNDSVSKTLSRLVKSDLIAAFNELIRQDQFDLALKVFSAIRSEDWYKTDLNLYAKLVTAMANKGMTDEIDQLMSDIKVEDLKSAEGKGLVTVIKALLAADRVEPTVRIYEMMKSGGWNCDSSDDEYIGKVLSRGFKRLGKKKVADEIDREIVRVSGGILEKVGV
ncbi:protein THYLAKOID ASSEMBLY 8, chloroplastic [Rutidosis leptorrhynchoides]|uniref:protein THYLAKOID ASSEMBLY 8, chloroplastic n=1 Tax=Rutidosis leptorrhynchoides TaxID=125765 RepID=UPI003A994F7D